MDIHQSAQIFLEELFLEMEKSNFALLPHWDIDHICYRNETDEQYVKMKTELNEFGRLLIESPVNGRLISTFQLFVPIQFHDYRIDLIELPAPKPGKIVKSGFEHIEAVCDWPFSQIQEQHPGLLWNQSGLKKEFNKELEVQFVHGAVKFHHLSLLSVINLEKNQRVWGALQESRVLFHFAHANPLIAGTFPLALDTKNSDIDLILQVQNLDELKSNCEFHYGQFEKFNTRFCEVDGLPTLLCNFEFQQIPFEIFAQDKPSSLQKAYQHYLAEEKILKYMGSAKQEVIKSFRSQGLKTEPAFAKALNLSGDPFEEILQLQQSSIKTLRQRFAG